MTTLTPTAHLQPTSSPHPHPRKSPYSYTLHPLPLRYLRTCAYVKANSIANELYQTYAYRVS